MKAIPTKYKGVQFKSKLEANWADWFDEQKIKWSYETEGYNINGIWYVPDFYLPDVKTIVEVKGALERLYKPLAFYKYLKKIQIDLDIEEYPKLAENDWFKKAYPSLELYKSSLDGDGEPWNPRILFLLAGPVPHFYKLSQWDDSGFALNYCKKFGATTIVPYQGSYSCRSCNEHDGTHSLRHVDGLLEPLNKPDEWID